MGEVYDARPEGIQLPAGAFRVDRRTVERSQPFAHRRDRWRRRRRRPRDRPRRGRCRRQSSALGATMARDPRPGPRSARAPAGGDARVRRGRGGTPGGRNHRRVASVRRRGARPERDLRSRGDDGRRVAVRRCVPAPDRLERWRPGGRRLDGARMAVAAHARSTTSARCCDRFASLASVAVDRARLSSTLVGAVRLVRADGAHRPADRSGQRANGGPHPRARARPGRSPGQRGVAGDVRRRRLPGDEPERRARGRRRRPSPRRRGPVRIGPAGRHGRARSAATNSCSWPRDRRA